MVRVSNLVLYDLPSRLIFFSFWAVFLPLSPSHIFFFHSGDLGVEMCWCFSAVPSKRVSFMPVLVYFHEFASGPFCKQRQTWRKQPQLFLSRTREGWCCFTLWADYIGSISKPFLPWFLNGTVGYSCTRKLNVRSFSGTETNWNGKVCIHSNRPHYPPEVGGCLQIPCEELFLAWPRSQTAWGNCLGGHLLCPGQNCDTEYTNEKQNGQFNSWVQEHTLTPFNLLI